MTSSFRHPRPARLLPPRQDKHRSRRCRASASTSREHRSRWSANRAPARACPRWRSCGLLPENAIVEPASQIDSTGAQPLTASDGRAAQDARQRHLDDLPGADDLAEPGVHRRLADRRSAAAAHGPEPAGARWPRRSSCSTEVGIPEPKRARRCLSARAVGRSAAARDDRDGDRLRAEAADRRRADHRARRHHPAADPRADRRAAGASTG